ncbi:hypothetical protein DVH05_001551 [Phytophthora capsici]|nr:hypothetical protein DVH05_001551 [Phytophthora capsici]
MSFDLLNEKLGGKVKVKKSKALVAVKVGDMEKYTDPYKLESQSAGIKGVIKKGIRNTYKIPEGTSSDLATKVATEATTYLVNTFGVKEPTPVVLTTREIEQLQKAFTETEYMGDAHIKLGQYLRRCWVAHSPKKFNAPYVTVVQSSGFGKSRMLRELALSANDPGINMTFLYMCMRERTSTGYIEATLKLREWLFNPLEDAEVKDISERLKTIYYYAIENWGAVQEQWVVLFSEASADAVAAETLANSLMSRRTTSAKTKRSQDHKRAPGAKMVVLVVDEARSLLRGRSDDGLNLFRKQRVALVSANIDIDGGGGVFAVLVDTNSKISDLSPPWVSDPPFKVTRDRLASFPPFVLAHTMDANWHKCCRDGLSEDKACVEDKAFGQ